MLKNQKLRVKLAVILLLACATVLAVTSAGLVFSWNARLAERKARLTDIVGVANGTLERLNWPVSRAQLADPEALTQTRKLFESMTQGDTESFFLIGFDGTVLLDPYLSLDGVNAIDLRDGKGRPFIREAIEVAKAGGGFVQYGAPIPNSSRQQEKIAYVARAPGNSALIGIAMVIDDLKTEFWERAVVFLGAIASIFFATLVLSSRIVKSVCHPIRQLLGAVELLSQGATDVVIEGAVRGDEVGELARGIQSWKRHMIRRDQLQREVEAAQQELLRHARYDDLTGLPNARALLDTLRDQLGKDQGVALIAISIQGLDRISALHGQAGQRHVLRTLADRLRGFCGRKELSARLDADEFAVLSCEPDPALLAGNIRTALSVPVQWGSLVLDIGLSIGLATKPEDRASAEEMLQAAITAARNSIDREITVYSPALRARLDRESRLEARLRHAVDHGLIGLALQPKINARSGRLVGAEALARWTDDEFGVVAPFEFIPMAERLGIIGDLDSVILRNALREAARWREAGLDLSVAVNVSANELRAGDLVGRIATALADAACAPSQLVVELTESAVAENPTNACRQLKMLKGLGVSLSLDDFGTGYSSLSHLRRFPIDTLKIDRSFVIDVPHDRDAATVVKTIVALATSLGIDTVAEGVETTEQADFLRALAVPTLQGYLVGRPMAPDLFMVLAKENHPDGAIAAPGRPHQLRAVGAEGPRQ